MSARLDRLATLAGYALLVFAGGYLAGHIASAYFGIDLLNALAGALGLVIGGALFLGALLGRMKAR